MILQLLLRVLLMVRLIIAINAQVYRLTFYLSTAATTGADRTSSQITAERPFSGSSAFTRTVWLPRPVDSNNVVAKLSDGILRITIPKAEDNASVKVRVD
jgi:HSP20 family molecular chaperone IbpA